jgi:hypothetical protein
MMPGSYPLKIYRGDSYHWQFKLWLDTDKTQPADLTSASAKAEIRDKAGGTRLFVLDCIITNPNIVDVKLTSDLSETLPTASLKWDLQLTYTDGQVNTIVAGPVTVTADITL